MRFKLENNKIRLSDGDWLKRRARCVVEKELLAACAAEAKLWKRVARSGGPQIDFHVVFRRRSASILPKEETEISHIPFAGETEWICELSVGPRVIPRPDAFRNDPVAKRRIRKCRGAETHVVL